MRDILSDLERWHADAAPTVLATVVETWGSAPRPPGGKMAVTADGRIAGSVSGGCVEGAVIEAGRKTLASGKPQLLHYGVSDDTAWSVGLACGGSLDVFVERLDPGFFAVVESGRVEGAIDEAALAEARGALAARASRRTRAGEHEIFVDVLLPPPRLVVVGGVHIAVALVTLAKAVGFRTIVVDPREA